MRTLPHRMSDSLYHDVYIPEETLKLRKKFRAFAEKEVFPIAYEFGQRRESSDNFPWALFQSMAKKGFFKVPHKKGDGGLGGSAEGLLALHVLQPHWLRSSHT